MSEGKSKLTILVDDEVKAKASAILADLGLNPTNAINAFLRAVVREGGIPFALSQEPIGLAAMSKQFIEAAHGLEDFGHPDLTDRGQDAR